MEYDYYYSAATAGTMLVTMLISFAVGIVCLVALWKIFVKAGEPGWACLVPFYNMYVLFKISWGNGWKFLLLLIPLANIVFGIMAYVKLGKAFGKSGGFLVGMVLLAPVFLCLLGFGSDRYLGVGGAGAAYAAGGDQQPTAQRPTYQRPAYQQPTYQQPTYQQPASGWTCGSCGTPNEGMFCANCGAKRPEPAPQAAAARPAFCPSCGARLEDSSKFCPNCGGRVE